MQRLNSSSQFTYPVHEEPIVLSKGLFDVFLKDERPSDVLSLYSFYYYTAKWQHTNQVRATTEYCANALRWTEDRVRMTKKRLIDYGLIEDVSVRGTSQQINGHYVRIRFIWKSSHTPDLPECGFPHTVAEQETNALSTNSRNALSANKKKKSEKNQIPPTSEMISNYCSENNYDIDTQQFIDFYTAKNWFVGKNKMVDWQAAVRTWVRRDSNSPTNTKKQKFIELTEIFKLADFKERHKLLRSQSIHFSREFRKEAFYREDDIACYLCDDGQYRDVNGNFHRP